MWFVLGSMLLFATLFFFMGVVAPKGEFLALNYKQLPGVNTPLTNATKGAWEAAHKKVALMHLAIAGIYLIGFGYFLFESPSEKAFLFFVVLGVLLEIPVIFIANKAARDYLDEHGEY